MVMQLGVWRGNTGDREYETSRAFIYMKEEEEEEEATGEIL